ncbi:hypothetical protein ACU5JM_00040 (plasmid) [Rhodococcus erythropolis]|uniref:hypothetical protein n=1 Tax=Rhodococcus erythropolis TaxID=1833 RepID=UPI00406BD32C
MHATEGPLGISEASGYVVRNEDLTLLGLDVERVLKFTQGELPLGMFPEDYSFFTDSLSKALADDGVADFDVRLQGSSAHFFSGPHKAMPYDAVGVLEAIREHQGRIPHKTELINVVRRIHAHWPEDLPRPVCRPFDVMHRLRIDRSPSDYDVQISSDEVVNRVRQSLLDLGFDPDDALVHHRTYAFVRKDLFDTCFRAVTEWRLLMTASLQRPVTVAAFPRTGPVKAENADEGSISSHFKDSDWVLFESGCS